MPVQAYFQSKHLLITGVHLGQKNRLWKEPSLGQTGFGKALEWRQATAPKRSGSALTPGENVAKRVEEAGVRTTAAGVVFEDVEKVVVKTAEGPGADGEQRGGAQMRRLQQNAAEGDEAGEKKEQAFGVKEGLAADIAKNRHGEREGRKDGEQKSEDGKTAAGERKAAMDGAAAQGWRVQNTRCLTVSPLLMSCFRDSMPMARWSST